MNKKLKEVLEKEIDDLIVAGEDLYVRFNDSDYTRIDYQSWFSKTSRIVEMILPERNQEFQDYYSGRCKYVERIYPNEYRLQMFFNGINITYESASISLNKAKILFSQQLSILKSCKVMLGSKLENIEYEIFIELNETELDTAKSLLKINLRASGCIAGVVLEKYLKSLLNKYNPNHGKKDNELTLNVINELLKEKAYDTKTFKNIQYLSDIRNLCDHDKKDSEGKTKEPTKADVETLIENTERIMKTIY